jgi:hypothetical protein
MKIRNGILHDIGYCISICLAKALTICLCCIMQSILSTKAIAFVVDFSVQNSVYINQNNFAASLLSPSLAVSLVLQGLFCLISENMLLNPNKPSSSTVPLRSLQEILHNRIKQKKGEMHKSHNIAYNDSLCTEIETIHWVLAQILTLLRQSQSA